MVQSTVLVNTSMTGGCDVIPTSATTDGCAMGLPELTRHSQISQGQEDSGSVSNSLSNGVSTDHPPRVFGGLFDDPMSAEPKATTVEPIHIHDASDSRSEMGCNSFGITQRSRSTDGREKAEAGSPMLEDQIDVCTSYVGEATDSPETPVELTRHPQISQWQENSGSMSQGRFGTYNEHVTEELTQEVSTDKDGASSTRSVTRVRKEVVRSGTEFILTQNQYSLGTVVQFEPCQRWVPSDIGRMSVNVERLRCYRDMAAITRVIPTSSDIPVQVHTLPWVDGIIGQEGDLLSTMLPTTLPPEVVQELSRFDRCCAAEDPIKTWQPSENKWVAAFASAVITTPMFMKASFDGQYFCVMVDLGASVSIYRDASLFPGVSYNKDVAPIGITGVTGDSMKCKGFIQAPLTLSIDGFDKHVNMAYGACTIQSGYTGKQTGQHSTRGAVMTRSQESLGINTSYTNLTIKFGGFHFPDAGPKTPIIGMDYFTQQSDSDQYSVPRSVDFLNSCLHFKQPENAHFMKMGHARVPVFSTVGILPRHDVLLSTISNVRLPPNGRASVRCIGHCGELASGTCIVQPHSGLKSIKSNSPGQRKYLISQYVIDPNLLIPAKAPHGNLKYGTDSRLQWLHDTISEDMGLIAVFGQVDELHDYTEVDSKERGRSHQAYHVEIINTSPVEMLLLAGQPLATALLADYKDGDRDIRYRARTTEGRKDPLTSRILPAVLGSLTDVHGIIKNVTQCEAGHMASRAKQSLLEQDQGTAGDTKLTWVPIHCMSIVTTSLNTLYNLPSLIGTINVQRGLLVGEIMGLIRKYMIENLEDSVLGRYRVSLGLQRLLCAHPTLVIPVLADMMVRQDTSEWIKTVFQQNPALQDDLVSAETGALNFETLLIIENWVLDDVRVSRITPFENGHPALVGFDTPWRDTHGTVFYTAAALPTGTSLQNQVGSIWNRLWTATDMVRKSHKTTSMNGDVHSFCNIDARQPLDSFDPRLSTMKLTIDDPNIMEMCSINSNVVIAAQAVYNIMVASREGALYSQANKHVVSSKDDQYPTGKCESYSDAMKRGLIQVTQGVTGQDKPIDGKVLDEAISGFQDLIDNRPRDLRQEAIQSEKDDPVSGDAESGPGYHFDRTPTQSELQSQLKEVRAEFEQRPEYPIVSRLVQTTDKDTDGNCIHMAWWRWTVIQSWRRLRAQEPDERLNGDAPENELYTLRSVLQVGLPNADELAEMKLSEKDRLLMVEMVWRLAPAFYQGPVLPEIRHFTFTKAFMSLVTDVPYRQKPLVIPLANEELVYSSIRAMIRDGVVETSLSPYNNGLLLVAKKAARPGAPSSGMRVVLDARGLNHITRRVTWPIEDLGLCLREVAGASFITVTDVLSGFHLIPLDPECRPATAFTCGSLGHLQYCRAGMGMANSPARFASALSAVLGGQRHNACGNGCNREGNGCAPGPSPDDLRNKTSFQVANGVDTTISEGRQVRHRNDVDRFNELVQAGEFDTLLDDVFAVHRCLCIVYVDDVTIATWYDRSQTTDPRMDSIQLKAHLQDVEAVLWRMRSFGIVCKAVKSEIARPRNDLLGYVVGRDGLRVNATKIDKLLDLDLPHSKEGLQFFIGLTGFYRQFVPRLAELETPLRSLLKHPDLPTAAPKRDQSGEYSGTTPALPCCWRTPVPDHPTLANGDPCTYMDLYRQILHELAKFTALSSIDYRPQSGRVGVASDASKVGLAAVLFQETPWGTSKSGETLWVERPIAFYSKVLLDQYQGRAAYDRELAALTLSVRHWSKYLLGRPVVFIADHQPLEFMLEPKGTSAADKRQSTRLIHFILELSRYNASAEWRRGTQIPVPDCISRLLKVVDTVFLTTKPCKGLVDPVRHNEECDKLSLVRSQPYTRAASDQLVQSFSNAEEGWVPEQNLEPAIQCIVSNTDLWGIAREELINTLKSTRTAEELSMMGHDDAEIYLTIVDKAKKALEDAQQCRMVGQANCTAEEWSSYVQLAEAIGIVDYATLSPTLTPLRHISTGGVLRNNVLSGSAWVQIDHGTIWDLQKEPVLTRNGTEEIMTNKAFTEEPTEDFMEDQGVVQEWEESLEGKDQQHFSVLNVQITVDRTPLEKLTGLDRDLCRCWGPIDDQDDPQISTIATTYTGHCIDSILHHQELVSGWNVYGKEPVSSQVDRISRSENVVSSVYTVALNLLSSKTRECQGNLLSTHQEYQKSLIQLNSKLHYQCNTQNYISIAEGVKVDMMAKYNTGQQLLHVFPIQTSEDNEYSGDEERLEGKGFLRVHDVNYTKAANIQLTRLWEAEARQCLHQQSTLGEEQVRVTWHNVNGLVGFIEALCLNPDGYFLSGLYPDVFGILEAKVYTQDPTIDTTIQSLVELLFQITGERYHVVKSLRSYQPRCGTVMLLRVGFLESRQWWTWMADLVMHGTRSSSS